MTTKKRASLQNPKHRRLLDVFLHFGNRHGVHIKKIDQNSRLLDLFQRPFHADGLDLVGSVADAGCVDEAEGNAFDVKGFLDGVSCGAGDLADDGAFLF